LKALDYLDSILIVQALEQLSDPTMQNGIKLVMPCVTRQRLTVYVKGKPNNSPQKQNLSPLKGRLRAAFPSTSIDTELSVCFFCDALVEQDYHKVATKKLHTNVLKMAMELNDTLLLAKLSSGDMIAMDAVYHKHCLTGFFIRHRSSMCQKK